MALERTTFWDSSAHNTISCGVWLMFPKRTIVWAIILLASLVCVRENICFADSSPAKQWTYSQLARSANHMHTASEVLHLYKMFLQDKTVSEVDRKAAEKDLPKWKERADQKMVRVGVRWLTPEEAKDQKLQANQLVSEAGRLIKVGQFDPAIEKLCKASKMDEDSLCADFILGLGYAIIGGDAQKANRHFAECVRRDPQHISALNNLALSEVRLGKYSGALSHWKLALELAPASPEMMQNIGRLLCLSQQGQLRIPSRLQSQFTDLYAMEAEAKDFNRRTGWLYMGYYTTRGEKPVDIEEKPASGEKTNLHTLRSNIYHLKRQFIGTGFVVYPEYILTNHHVIKNATEIFVVLDEGKRKLPASVVGVAEGCDDGRDDGRDNGLDDDFAVIHCKGLTAPPVPFIKTDLVPRGTEIMVLGFPARLAGRLITTRGTISGLPDKFRNRYTMDATINGGNSGGPVCDKKGNVLGVVVSGSGGLAMNYSVSIPHSRALPLLKKCIPNYVQLSPNTEVKEWVDVDNLLSRSTFHISVVTIKSLSNCGITRKLDPQRPQNPQINQSQKSGVLEDRRCMRCNGSGVVACTNRKCNKGSVSVKKPVVYAVDPATGQKFYRQKFFGTPCPTCNGKGKVPCPDCRGGIDKSLL